MCYTYYQLRIRPVSNHAEIMLLCRALLLLAPLGQSEKYETPARLTLEDEDEVPPATHTHTFLNTVESP